MRSRYNRLAMVLSRVVAKRSFDILSSTLLVGRKGGGTEFSGNDGHGLDNRDEGVGGDYVSYFGINLDDY
ncbi:hypothetical protein PSY81_23890, partial [Shigella flexneri]|nr:hypothetical protein [Shigella flexneri]